MATIGKSSLLIGHVKIESFGITDFITSFLRNHFHWSMADKVAESVNDGVTSISNLAREAAGGSDSLDPQIQAREGIFYGSLIYVFKFVSLI